MAMRRASQAASGRHAAIGRGFRPTESSGGGDVRLDRRPCRKATRLPMIARLLIGLKIKSRWLRSAAQYGGQITSCSQFSGGQREMIMKQFAALAVLALTLSACVSSPIGAAADGATAQPIATGAENIASIAPTLHGIFIIARSGYNRQGEAVHPDGSVPDRRSKQNSCRWFLLLRDLREPRAQNEPLTTPHLETPSRSSPENSPSRSCAHSTVSKF